MQCLIHWMASGKLHLGLLMLSIVRLTNATHMFHETTFQWCAPRWQILQRSSSMNMLACTALQPVSL